MPAELRRVDALLDDDRFFEPYVEFFHASWGRPSIPIETYLRLMFLKYRYRLGFETLCREMTDSITWQRFCRIPLGGRVPHPTTLMKSTTRCGQVAVDGLNEALLARAVADTGHLEAGRRHRSAAAVQHRRGQRLLVRIDPHIVLVAHLHPHPVSGLRSPLGHYVRPPLTGVR
jgi:IS5 family transposase